MNPSIYQQFNRFPMHFHYVTSKIPFFKKVCYEYLRLNSLMDFNPFLSKFFIILQKLYPNFVHFIFKKSVGTQKDEYENFDKVFSSFPAGMSLFTFNWVD